MKTQSNLRHPFRSASAVLILLSFATSSIGQHYLPLAHAAEIVKTEGKQSPGSSATIADEGPDGSHHHPGTCSTCQVLGAVQPSDLSAVLPISLFAPLIQGVSGNPESLVTHEYALQDLHLRGPPSRL